MPRNFSQTLALSLFAAAALAPAAMAGQWPVFDHITLTPDGIPPVITVLSEDGVTWTKVKQSNILLSGNIDVQMDKGRVQWVWIKHNNTEIMNKVGSHNKSFAMAANLPTSTSNFAIEAISAVSACNAKLGTGKGIEEDHYTGITTSLELFAHAETNNEKLTRSNFGNFPVTVKCVGVPKADTPAADAADDLAAEFGIKSASLSIRKPKSNACPNTAEITARFATTMEGKVTFIYRQAGGGKSKAITINARKTAGGKFAAIHKQLVPVNDAIDTKYMVEAVGKGVISNWAALVMPCKIGLGGNGGLAQPPLVPIKALAAQLGIIGPKTKLCPAKATMKVWIKTNKAGKIGFRMVKKGGPVGQMIFATAVKGPAGYMATYSKELSIHQPLDTAYAVNVPGGVQSNFVPLKASCALKLPGEIDS